MDRIQVMVSAPGVAGRRARDALEGCGLAPVIRAESDLGRVLEALLSRRYECAILGGPTATELLAEAARAASLTPVILLEGPVAETTMADAIAAGAHDLLLPADLNPERMAAAVAGAARVFRAERRAAAAEARRGHQSLYDADTGLPQAPLFFDRLDQALAAARRREVPAAVGVLAIDGLEGAGGGDAAEAKPVLIRAVANRLRLLARQSDTVAHLGDGLFAVLMAPRLGAGGAEAAASRMRDAARRPVPGHGTDVALSVTAGVALFPDHGEDGAVLLRRADLAMRAARRTGSPLAVYDGSDDARGPAVTAGLAAELPAAVRDGSSSYSSPRRPWHRWRCGARKHWSAGGTRATGCSRPRPSCRWRSRRAPSPRSRCTFPSSRWRNRRTGRGAGLDIPVAVNVPAAALADEIFPAAVGEALARHGAGPGDLTVEVTESVVMQDPAAAAEAVVRLGRHGAAVAIDDFGAGFTSLSLLGRLAVSELKIDRSFAQDLAEGGDALVILRSVIELGRSLGLTVVAEGVEDAGAWNLLRRLRCDVKQGYYVSRPLDSAALVRWVRGAEWRRLEEQRVAS